MKLININTDYFVNLLIYQKEYQTSNGTKLSQLAAIANATVRADDSATDCGHVHIDSPRSPYSGHTLSRCH